MLPCTYHENSWSQGLHGRFKGFQVGGIYKIHFVQNNPAFPFQQRGTVGFQFPKEGEDVVHRIRPGQIHHQEDQPCTFNMPKEGQSHAAPLVGSTNKAGNVHEGETVLPGVFPYPQIGDFRGEGIGAHPCTGPGQCPQQGGLAGVGVPHQRHIREKFQFKPENALFSFFSRFCDAGRPPCGRGETRVAPSSSSSPRHQQTITFVQQFSQLFAGQVIVHQGPRRNPDLHIPPPSAMTAVGSPGAAIFGLKNTAIAKIQQGFQAGVHHKIDVSPVPTVSSIRSSPGSVFFPVEMNHPVPAFPGANADGDQIHKGVLLHRPKGYALTVGLSNPAIQGKG